MNVGKCKTRSRVTEEYDKEIEGGSSTVATVEAV